jgi:hypothetical protein
VKFLRRRAKFILELIVLAVLVGIWINITVDEISRWFDADETAGMAERYVQRIPFGTGSPRGK